MDRERDACLETAAKFLRALGVSSLVQTELGLAHSSATCWALRCLADGGQASSVAKPQSTQGDEISERMRWALGRKTEKDGLWHNKELCVSQPQNWGKTGNSHRMGEVRCVPWSANKCLGAPQAQEVHGVLVAGMDMVGKGRTLTFGLDICILHQHLLLPTAGDRPMEYVWVSHRSPC